MRGLTTRGRSLVAAGMAAAVCALVLDERDLFRVGVLLVALPVLSALVLGWARLGLDVRRSVEPQTMSVGAAGRVTLTLHAGRRLPVAGLLLSDAVPAVLGEQPCYAVGALAPGATAPVRYELTPRQRGRHVLGPVEVRLADPLGLVELRRSIPGTTEVVVRPARTPLDGLPGHVDDRVETGGTTTGIGGAQQSAQDAQIRPYRDGDDLRSVHWRSTARRDELMVRPPEQTRHIGTVVLLDVRTGAHHGVGPSSTLERAIGFAASALAHLEGARPVRLLTSEGVDLGRGESALDQLALLTTRSGASLGGVGEAAAHDELIAVLGTADLAGAELLISAARDGGPGRAVVFGGEGSGVEHLRRGGWTVVVAGGRATASQLWNEMCTAAPAGALL